jgi:competence protein ComEC
MAGLFALTDLPHLPSWLSFRVPDPPLWVGCGFALSIFVAALALRGRAWAFGLSVAALGLMTTLVAIHPFSPPLPSGILEVTALDCGQGDSLFLVLPDKTTMLVDASGSRHRSTSEGAFQGRLWDPGEDIVSAYLWSRGIKKIDIVVLSHPHEDHLGGLFAVVRNFQVGEFWHAANVASPVYSGLLERVRQKGGVEQTLVGGDELERGGVAVRVLWPARSWRPSGLPSDDDSLVLRLTYHGGSVLLPGDISTKAEQELLASGEGLESQVLKVAHHGSNSSSSAEFLARVNPRLAILTGGSSGFGNLPSPETLKRLRERGIRVFRSDVDGATTVQMRDRSLVVRCYGALSPGSAAPAAAAWVAGGLTLQVR